MSVVIPTYQRGHAIRESIEALLSDSTIAEVLVVIDGSTDSTEDVVAALGRSDKRIRAVVQANAGENAARQTGLQHATFPWVLFLDDDVIAGPNLATLHLRRLQSAGAHAIVLGYMPVALPRNRRAGDYATHIYASEYELACKGFEDGTRDVLGGFWAGNFSMSRKTALSVGLGIPDFKGKYHADQALGWRFQRAGLTAVFARECAATHLYRRPHEAFKKDAVAQGLGALQLETAHGVRRLTFATSRRARLIRVLPPPVLPIARGVTLLGASVVSLLASAAGVVHLWEIEMLSGRLTRKILQAYGYLLGQASATSENKS